MSEKPPFKRILLEELRELPTLIEREDKEGYDIYSPLEAISLCPICKKKYIFFTQKGLSGEKLVYFRDMVKMFGY